MVHHYHPSTHPSKKHVGEDKRESKEEESKGSGVTAEKVELVHGDDDESSGLLPPPLPRPQKVGIPLDGCVVELVRDGLGGRSEMVRRAPLLLSHPSCPLLDGERALFIFASDPAAKQQWLHALSYWCRGGERLRSVEKTYAEFCAVAEKRSLIPFITETPPPQSSHPAGGNVVGSSSSGGGARTTAGEKQQQQQQHEGQHQQQQQSTHPKKSTTWKRWRKGGKSSGAEGASSSSNDTRAVHSTTTTTTTTTTMNTAAARGVESNKSTCGGPLSQGAPAQLTPASTAAAAVGVLSDIDSIIEQRWMQPRKMKPPAPAPAPSKRAPHDHPSGSGSNSSSRGISPSFTPLGGASPVASPMKYAPVQSNTFPSSTNGVAVVVQPSLSSLGEDLHRTSNRSSSPCASMETAAVNGVDASTLSAVAAAVTTPLMGSTKTSPTKAPSVNVEKQIDEEREEGDDDEMESEGARGGASPSSSPSPSIPTGDSVPSSTIVVIKEREEEGEIKDDEAHGEEEGETTTADHDLLHKKKEVVKQQTIPVSLPPSPPTTTTTTTTTPPPPEQQQQRTTTKSSSSSRLPPGLPTPLLPIDFFMNAASTRIAFDLLRNPAFAEHVRARIQRQLSRMHTPDYVQSLEVISVEPGASAPSLANFACIPPPSASAAWPQLLFDMKYHGSFTVTVECKVDIRDAPAWSALDHALDRIEGKRKQQHDSSSGGGGSGGGKVATEEGEEEDVIVDYSLDDDDDDDRGDERRLLHRSSDGGDSSSSSSMADSFRKEPLASIAKGGADGGGGGASSSSSSSLTAGEQHHSKGGGGGGGGGHKRRFLGHLRHSTAQKLRQLAETTATRISKLPLRVSLTFSVLEGTICVWIPPPPGDRLFWSFLSPPKLSLTASPEIGGRLLKYAYHASRASAWIQARFELSFKKNLVFPGGGDIPLQLLLPSWDPRAADTLPGLDKEKERNDAATAGHGRRERDERRTTTATTNKNSSSAAAAPPPVTVVVVEQQQKQQQQQQQQQQPRVVEAVRVQRVNVMKEVNLGTNAATTTSTPSFVQVQVRRPPPP